MKRNRKGFTILEVLVTIVIMSIALWSLSALQTISIASNYTSHRLTIATMLAQDKLEELRSLAWDDPQLIDLQPGNWNAGALTFDWTQAPDHTNANGPSGQANPINQNGVSVAAGNPLMGYWREWNVVDGAPYIHTKTISVRVRWSEKTNYQVTVDTVMSEG